MTAIDGRDRQAAERTSPRRRKQANDFDKATDLGAQLDAARKEREALAADTAKRMQALQEKQINREQRGQTRRVVHARRGSVPVAQTPATMAVEVKPAPAVEAAPAVDVEATEAEQRAETLRKSDRKKRDAGRCACHIAASD
jgi:hypothetical protein